MFCAGPFYGSGKVKHLYIPRCPFLLFGANKTLKNSYLFGIFFVRDKKCESDHLLNKGISVEEKPGFLFNGVKQAPQVHLDLCNVQAALFTSK